MLSLRIQADIRQSLELIGGATRSIFPHVEALLIGNSDYSDALEYVASRKNVRKYYSIMDFLFCELNPGHRRHCQRYYAGMGPLLKELITPKQLIQYNKQLLVALEVALECLNEKRRESWGWYRERVAEALKAA